MNKVNLIQKGLESKFGAKKKHKL